MAGGGRRRRRRRRRRMEIRSAAGRAASARRGRPFRRGEGRAGDKSDRLLPPPPHYSGLRLLRTAKGQKPPSAAAAGAAPRCIGGRRLAPPCCSGDRPAAGNIWRCPDGFDARKPFSFLRPNQVSPLKTRQSRCPRMTQEWDGSFAGFASDDFHRPAGSSTRQRTSGAAELRMRRVLLALGCVHRVSLCCYFFLAQKRACNRASFARAGEFLNLVLGRADEPFLAEFRFELGAFHDKLVDSLHKIPLCRTLDEFFPELGSFGGLFFSTLDECHHHLDFVRVGTVTGNSTLFFLASTVAFRFFIFTERARLIGGPIRRFQRKLERDEEASSHR